MSYNWKKFLFSCKLTLLVKKFLVMSQKVCAHYVKLGEQDYLSSQGIATLPTKFKLMKTLEQVDAD
jgi:hypothetical protein